ncbi:MAG: ECF transporter S component [Moorellaceae bacterium]
MWRNIRFLTTTALLLALTVAVQMVGLPHPVTGPLVNAMLLLATLTVGIAGGVFIGVLTPWVALLRGILPPLAQPITPFIMVANTTLVIAFGLLARLNPWLALLVAALCKYGVFVVVLKFILVLPPKLAQAFQVPQLLTALAGGVIALLVHKALPERYKRPW